LISQYTPDCYPKASNITAFDGSLKSACKCSSRQALSIPRGGLSGRPASRCRRLRRALRR
jgi:hypothetical protein